jgi:hypothetical protein
MVEVFIMTATRQRTSSLDQLPSVAIVGGGIAGLFAAWHLGRSKRFRVTLFEALPKLGGKIETVDICGFNAELGPMRFEPKAVQPTFHRLCQELGISLVKFPVPMAGPSPYKPELFYNEERATQGDAKALLRLGTLKLFGQRPSPRSVFQAVQGTPNKESKWIQRQAGDAAINRLRGTMLGATRLNDYGFWNALTMVLSHQAVDAIRNRGTFYHFINENPNALEWAIFWLRAFQAPDGYLTIPRGVSTLTKALEQELASLPLVDIQLESRLVRLEDTGGFGQAQLFLQGPGGAKRFQSFDEVILALPQWPLLQLADSLPEPIVANIRDSVVPVPMIKVFQVSRRPSPWVRYKWRAWKEDHRADPDRGPVLAGQVPFLSQGHELTVPTRESHVFYRDSDDFCMRMFYLDRPFTAFWEQLLTTERSDHWNAEIYATRAARVDRKAPGSPVRSISQNPPLLDAVTRCIRASEAVQLFSDGLDNVDTYLANPRAFGVEPQWLKMPGTTALAVRDWSGHPCAGAAHLWRSGVDSEEVRESVTSFSLEGHSRRQNVHICGEAFSDAQGFIEGALTSTSLVLGQLIPGWHRRR